MVAKRSSKLLKQSKRVKDLAIKSLKAKQAKGVRGGWSGPGDEGPEESLTLSLRKK